MKNTKAKRPCQAVPTPSLARKQITQLKYVQSTSKRLPRKVYRG